VSRRLSERPQGKKKKERELNPVVEDGEENTRTLLLYPLGKAASNAERRKRDYLQHWAVFQPSPARKKGRKKRWPGTRKRRKGGQRTLYYFPLTGKKKEESPSLPAGGKVSLHGKNFPRGLSGAFFWGVLGRKQRCQGPPPLRRKGKRVALTPSRKKGRAPRPFMHAEKKEEKKKKVVNFSLPTEGRKPRGSFFREKALRIYEEKKSDPPPSAKRGKKVLSVYDGKGGAV